MTNTKYPNIVEFQVVGDYGLFSDPITRIGGEKCSYQIPTYEALKGILSSVYWKPTIIWYINSVRIVNQIQTEVKGIRPIKYTGGNDLSYYTYLRKCRYQVKAHFEWNLQRADLEKDRNENKHFDMACRSLEKGGRRDIFLGTRECQGYVEPCLFEDGKSFYDDEEPFSFGLMFHGFDYPSEVASKKLTARFWNVKMEKGVITFPRPEDCDIRREIRDYSVINPMVNTEEDDNGGEK